MNDVLYHSVGVLKYTNEPSNLRVVIDPGIADFYRALIPKWIYFNKPMYPPHISAIRKEIVPNLEAWRKYDGHEIDFTYSNIIHHGQAVVR